MTPLTPERARRVFLLLGVTRWFPVGLIVAVTTLLPLERGLSVTQALTSVAAIGIAVFLLELPTGGLADALGRRPVLIAAGVMQVVAVALICAAQSFWAFFVASLATGVFRALDSGPLEAWYVDTVHATSPGADVDRTLSQQGAVLGIAMASGAVVSGGLVLWHPVQAWSAITFPFVVYLGLAVVHLAVTVALVREAPRSPDGRATGVGPAGTAARPRRSDRFRTAVSSARQAPGIIRDGLHLARRSRALRGLLWVEVFWSVGMVTFESLQPIRLAEMLGSEESAAAVMGPVAAGGWGVFALGSWLVGLVSARIGLTRAAMLARLLNGLGAVWMGLVGGPVALIVAYLVTYSLHGAGGPVYRALLHRETDARTRSTVLSMSSMTGFAAFAVAAPLLGLGADLVSTSVAMVVAGAVSTIGVVFYLPALRKERSLVTVP
jgi:predicted MFS family arabinose efflux permease